MSFPYTALSVDIEEDLLPLTTLLHERGVAHRIFEEGGQQVVRVAEESHVEPLRALYRSWRDGDVGIELAPSSQSPQPAKIRSAGLQAPITTGLIALSVAGFLLVYANAPVTWLAQLTFSPFTVLDGQILFSETDGQYWRLVTPAFLHFGWLHIVFNSLWLWELGSKVERTMGGGNMLGLFLVIATVSNSVQFLFGGAAIFGGMSGVVYGLLGYCWVGAKVQPRWQFQPATPIMLFMVGWLVICMLGVVEVLGFGAIANAAHVGGLLAGASLGLLFGLLSRFSMQR
ncbi:MAG: GlpG protein [Alcanivorax sp.]|jgi:GlpG protein